MAEFSLGVRTAAAAAGAPYADLVATANGALHVKSIHVINTTTIAAAVGLIRATANGTRTTPVVGLAMSGYAAAVAVGGVAVAWSVAPTLATNYHERGMVPASIGAGFFFEFSPGELIIPPSGSLLVANPTGTGQILDVTLRWWEP